MSYDLFIEPDVHDIRRDLPGHFRQRIRRLIDELGATPRPAGSRALDITGLALPSGVELRRIRLDRWRIVYAVSDAEQWVWLLALRRRPPYSYDDLPELANRLPASK